MSENKLDELETLESLDDEEEVEEEEATEKSFAYSVGEWVGDHKVETGLLAGALAFGIKKGVDWLGSRKPKQPKEDDDNLLKAIAEGRFSIFHIEPRKKEVIAIVEEEDEDDTESVEETEEQETPKTEDPEKEKTETKKKGK